MTPLLPPLRLTGALALRDGALQRRSVVVAEGRFTSGPHPAVDLDGFYLLPGIVDLHATGFHRHLDGAAGGLDLVDAEAASHGVTTRFLSQPWAWERHGVSPAAATELARALAAHRAHALTDLHLQLACETLMTADEAALLNLVRACGIDQVMFTNRAETLHDLRRHDPAGFARWAWTWGTDGDTLSAALDAVLPNARSVPRHLCRLAEAFDRIGVVYGSTGDTTAETREHYSMIGARLCLLPASSRAAAAAKAVGDPVLAGADDILHPAPSGRPQVLAMLRAGQCDALVSGPHSASPLRAAFRLVAREVMPLERAWALISQRPAEIMRLPDRGTITPGKRADLAIVNAATQMVEATICAGRLTFLTGEAAARFLGAGATGELAAE